MLRLSQLITFRLVGRLHEIDPAVIGRGYRLYYDIAIAHVGIPVCLEHYTGIWYTGISGPSNNQKALNDYPDCYAKAFTPYWDSYTGQQSVILKDFCTAHRHMAKHLVTWADSAPFVAKLRYSEDINIRPLHIIVTSRYTIQELFEDHHYNSMKIDLLYRFKVHHINPLKNEGTQ